MCEVARLSNASKVLSYGACEKTHRPAIKDAQVVRFITNSAAKVSLEGSVHLHDVYP